MQNDYHHIARITYERFCLSQYHIKTEGLYYSNRQYFVYCPDVKKDSLTIEGTTISEWFDSYKPLGTDIRLSTTLLPDFSRVDTSKEVSSLQSGYLMTGGDVYNEIDLLIPKIFPAYKVYTATSHGGIDIYFSEELSADGKAELERIFVSNEFPFNCKFLYSDTQTDFTENLGLIDLPLYTSRQIKSKISSKIQQLWEEDEDTWLDTRNSILHGTPSAFNLYDKSSLNTGKLKCLVDGSFFIPDNIRNYLTLFDQICLVLPPRKHQTDVLNGLGISFDELAELVRLSKVQLLLPQSIERYDTAFIEQVIETSPNCIHLCREITSLTLSEVKKRNPLFLPSVPINERQLMLSAIDEMIDTLKIKAEDKQNLKNGISELGLGWLTIPNMANQHDSASISQLGITTILQTLPGFASNDNVRFGLNLAVPSVDWAAATKSVLIPPKGHGIDLTPFSSMIANLYSGLPNQEWLMDKADYANFAVDDILSIASQVSTVDLAQTFTGAEIERFREYIFSISKNQTSIEELAEVTSAFNKCVKDYEKNKNKLNSYGIKGMIISLLTQGTSMGKPLTLLLNMVLKHSSKSKALGQLINTLEAEVNVSFPDAILVSQMRDKLKNKM